MGRLDELIGLAPADGWISDVGRLNSLRSTHGLSTNESKKVVRDFASAVASADARSAINFAAIGICVDDARFIAAIRRRGYLRATKYDLRVSHLEVVVNELIDSGLAAAGTPHGNYFSSLKGLYVIGGQTARFRDHILAELDHGREPLLKALMATVDFYFLSGAWRGVVFGDRSRPSSDHQFFSSEEYAEAFSYLFHIHHERHGAWRENPSFDSKLAFEPLCSELLLEAAHVRVYHELETMVDAFGYSIREVSSRSFVVDPPSLGFERAFRLGYIQTQWQSVADLDTAPQGDFLSLRQMGERLYEAAKDGYIFHRSSPVERYAFGLPNVPELTKLIAEEMLFLEEHVYLQSACRTLLTDEAHLLSFEVAPGLSIKNILRGQRVFSILRWFAAYHLMPIALSDRNKTGVVLQSLVPYMDSAQLKSLLQLVMSADSAEKFIDVFSWEPSRDPFFDLQYQPFVETSGGKLVAINLLAGSNIVRNSLVLRQTRLFEDGSDDPASELLASTFRRYSSQTEVGVEYSFLGTDGEIDVVCLIGDLLVVNECKNPLLPAGPHEMRNSWEYVEKAQDQLDTFQRLFADVDFRQHFESRFGHSLAGVKRVATCIVMSNRMFCGYRSGNHPVRGLQEYVHYLLEGTVAIGEESKKYWAGEVLCSDDLVRYLESDIVHKPQFDAMEPFEVLFQFGDVEVRSASFKLRMEKLADILGFTKAFTDLSEAAESAGGFVH